MTYIYRVGDPDGAYWVPTREEAMKPGWEVVRVELEQKPVGDLVCAALNDEPSVWMGDVEPMPNA